MNPSHIGPPHPISPSRNLIWGHGVGHSINPMSWASLPIFCFQCLRVLKVKVGHTGTNTGIMPGVYQLSLLQCGVVHMFSRSDIPAYNQLGHIDSGDSKSNSSLVCLGFRGWTFLLSKAPEHCKNGTEKMFSSLTKNKLINKHTVLGISPWFTPLSTH